MDDLVKRLLAGTGGGKHWMDLHEEAAARIVKLERSLKATCRREAATATRYDARFEALEARIAKADALADAFESYDNAAVDHMDFQEAVYTALAAYREGIE